MRTITSTLVICQKIDTPPSFKFLMSLHNFLFGELQVLSWGVATKLRQPKTLKLNLCSLKVQYSNKPVPIKW